MSNEAPYMSLQIPNAALALQVAPPEAESSIWFRGGCMRIHDPITDPLQPRHTHPAGSPPERFPEDDDDQTEANDEEDDFDDDDDVDEGEDEEEDLENE